MLNITTEGIKIRLPTVEEMINEIGVREEEYKEGEEQRGKWISRNERILREIWDQSKHNNIRVIGVPEEEGDRIRDRKCL